MAVRPHMTTPTDDLIMVLRATGDLCERNAVVFRRVLGASFDGKKEAQERADTLDDTEGVYQTEKRQDVAWTNDKDEVVERTGRLGVAFRSAAELAYRGSDDLSDILNDFKTEPPSRIRTLTTAQGALRTLKAGVEEHRPALQAAVANIQELEDELDELLDRVDELGDGYAAESSETRAARRERDAAREAALDFIERVELGARIAAVDTPGLLDELDAIFREHVTQPSRTTNSDDEDVDVEPVADPNPA